MSPPVSEPSTSSALTLRQAQVVLALAQGATVTAAAAAAGLHRCTIYRWLNTQNEFEEAVRQASSDSILALREELKDARGAVLATLRPILTDAQTPPAMRLRLALAFLEHAPSARRLRPQPPAASRPKRATECNAV